MNVFILNSGRCGSMTIAKACTYITNYTSAHESRNSMSVHERLNYPDNHIESDNRLSWFLGKLDIKYGNNAIYIHLIRNKKDTSLSFTNRFKPNHIIDAYRSTIYYDIPINTEEDKLDIAMDYYETVNSNISLFLKDKTKKMEFHIDKACVDFRKFWVLINAEGDLVSAINVFGTKHNSTENNLILMNKYPLLKKIFNKIDMFVHT